MQRHQMQDDEDQANVADSAPGEEFDMPVEDDGGRALPDRPRRPELPPELSAETLLWPWQKRAMWAVLLTATAALFIAPVATGTVLFAAMAIPFLCVVLLRVAAIERLAMIGNVVAQTVREDSNLPTYTVLVPLYHEAQTIPGLVAALSRLDYPTHLLDIVLIAEEVDGETQFALEQADLPSHMRVMVVPDGAPRTKPRALIYALARTRGERVPVAFGFHQLEMGSGGILFLWCLRHNTARQRNSGADAPSLSMVPAYRRFHRSKTNQV